MVDAAQVSQLGLIMPMLEQTLLSIEREFRDRASVYHHEDVQARSQRYIDFLLPGLMALTLMNLSIAGSGFNIVEYRRKGILKRLFVTRLSQKISSPRSLCPDDYRPGSAYRADCSGSGAADIRIVGNFFVNIGSSFWGQLSFYASDLAWAVWQKLRRLSARLATLSSCRNIPVRDLLSDRVDAGMDNRWPNRCRCLSFPLECAKSPTPGSF